MSPFITDTLDDSEESTDDQEEPAAEQGPQSENLEEKLKVLQEAENVEDNEVDTEGDKDEKWDFPEGTYSTISTYK